MADKLTPKQYAEGGEIITNGELLFVGTRSDQPQEHITLTLCNGKPSLDAIVVNIDEKVKVWLTN